MKKFSILLIAILSVACIHAQNVAINTDGSAAHSSSILDVKSTNKGALLPRMTSAQRTAIATPAQGLLVFDTDTQSFWVYNGTTWINMAAGGGGSFALPYSQTVNTNSSAFQITNQGTGASMEGSSSAQFGIGMTAKSTGAGGWGLYAFSNGAGAQSIRSYADNGTAFHGENNIASNTNTLMNLLNKGAGKTGSFQLSNSTSTSANVQIAGNNLSHQLKIYQTNAANSQAAVSIENSGTGTGLEATTTIGDGIVGTSNTGYGIRGVTTTALGKAGVHGQNNGTAGSGVVGVSHAANTQGVYGSSQNGIAVRALGDNYRAVQATSTSGTALYGSSTNGYALESNGNVKISGGNTNPGAGKVLTSDASGNATWQTPVSTPKVAFKVSDAVIGQGINFLLPVEYKRIQYKTVEYDLTNSYQIYAGSEEGNIGTFTVPVSGVYHFDAAINLLFATTFDYREINLELRVYRNGATSVIAKSGSYINDVDNTYASLSTDVRLYANDIVWIAANQYNTISMPSPLIGGIENYFNGHLVFPL